MIRSVGHLPTIAWHRTHLLRHKRVWVIMACIILAALFFWVSGYFNTVGWSALGTAVILTTYRLIIAYVIALILGVTIALIVGWSSFAELLFPVFDVLQNIPSFALVPFFIYFFGYTNEMIIMFAVSSVIWPILFAVLTAIKNAHTDLNDAATIFGATGIRRILYYLAPLSFPAILTGSIVGVAIGWEAVIGAEIITAVGGFGTFIKDASVTGVNQSAVAGLFVILLIVFIVNRIVWAPLLAQSAKRYAE